MAFFKVLSAIDVETPALHSVSLGVTLDYIFRSDYIYVVPRSISTS